MRENILVIAIPGEYFGHLIRNKRPFGSGLLETAVVHDRTAAGFDFHQYSALIVHSRYIRIRLAFDLFLDSRCYDKNLVIAGAATALGAAFGPHALQSRAAFGIVRNIEHDGRLFHRISGPLVNRVVFDFFVFNIPCIVFRLELAALAVLSGVSNLGLLATARGLRRFGTGTLYARRTGFFAARGFRLATRRGICAAGRSIDLYAAPREHHAFIVLLLFRIRILERISSCCLDER